MKESKKGCDLKSCFLCKLSLAEWSHTTGAHRKNYSYKKGEQVFLEGDKVEGIFFVYEGTIKVHKKWGDKELILRFAKKGDVFGHRGFGKETFYPISATALDNVTVCFIDISFFLVSLKVNYDFIFELMKFYAQELQESEKNMRNLAHMPVKGRVATALLKLKDKFGENEDGYIQITLSRQDLAAYAGTTYETVFRLMTEFAEEGLVRTSGKDIAILDAPKLTLLTQE